MEEWIGRIKNGGILFGDIDKLKKVLKRHELFWGIKKKKDEKKVACAIITKRVSKEKFREIGYVEIKENGKPKRI